MSLCNSLSHRNSHINRSRARKRQEEIFEIKFYPRTFCEPVSRNQIVEKEDWISVWIPEPFIVHHVINSKTAFPFLVISILICCTLSSVISNFVKLLDYFSLALFVMQLSDKRTADLLLSHVFWLDDVNWFCCHWSWADLFQVPLSSPIPPTVIDPFNSRFSLLLSCFHWTKRTFLISLNSILRRRAPQCLNNLSGARNWDLLWQGI